MAALAALRRINRSCVIGSRFGSLRLNGLYLVPSHVVVPAATQGTSQALVPYQAKPFSVSPVSHGAPEIEQAGHDHVLHWTAERILSVVLLGAIPAAIIFPTPAVESILALSMTVHSHWGIEAIVVDYIRPSLFGKIIPKLAVGAVYTLSFLTLGGLCYFIYTDVGIINAVKLLWKL
ncbi:succinate dehydrogenase [ubiquinone] cytochrome b small subunit, mitochondrial-like [Homarus americanus]|uniref:Succinate dehydrogenase [ubiquinone] cytochrome b small subunit n=1 Tax=Homarus americanus TaxID=6706 RepID=A0A8J5K0F0_HOMAM|nr:succinate dehydrogenase [ubiquinone] cytochrome b small subunit, mitochondrial-like [Homarus americanus]KAG7164233.1 Succinate dehydrogenase [ubiquinone] cytochrome b small subunit-like [Homarus americanus]